MLTEAGMDALFEWSRHYSDQHDFCEHCPSEAGRYTLNRASRPDRVSFVFGGISDVTDDH